MRAKFVLALAMLAAVTRLCAAEITVFAAASLQESLTEIGAAFERNTGEKVTFNFGASSTLARQIEQGAPADLFFSADEAKMDALEKKGLLASGTRLRLLSNQLVIVVPQIAAVVPADAADLAKPEFKKVALAEPSSVPVGIYAREYLESRGLWAAVKEKVLPTENVRGALAAVEAGNAEAGIVYKTDALISRKVKVAVEVPADKGPKISYPVAVLKDSKQQESAKKFAEYLAKPEARAVFEKFGFGRQ